MSETASLGSEDRIAFKVIGPTTSSETSSRIDVPNLESRQTSTTLGNSPIHPKALGSRASPQQYLHNMRFRRITPKELLPTDRLVNKPSQDFSLGSLFQSTEGHAGLTRNDTTLIMLNEKHPAATRTAWKILDRTLTKEDRIMVEGWKAELDNLLVYTGLFSAVVTAFCVESFKLLDQDPEDVMVLLLGRISARLDGTNGTQIPIPTDPNATTTFARRINIMWFSSLVLALSTAFVCILVKQWLREYLKESPGSPRDNARIRQFRYQGFLKWRVPNTIALLPLLLETSLAFFFAGLVDLLWNLDSMVAIVITIFVSIASIFVVITTILPSFFLDSPHRSPQAYALFRLSRIMITIIYGLALRTFWFISSLFSSTPEGSPASTKPVSQGSLTSRSRSRRAYQNWHEYEKHWTLKMERSLDRHILACADATLMDDSFLWNVIRVCINDTESRTASAIVLDILRNRAPDIKETRPPSDPEGSTENNVIPEHIFLAEMIVGVLSRLQEDDCNEIQELLQYLAGLCAVIPFTNLSRDLFELYVKAFRLASRLLIHSGHRESEDIRSKAFELTDCLFRRSDIHIVDENVILDVGFFAYSQRDERIYYRACAIALLLASYRHKSSSTKKLRKMVTDILMQLLENIDNVPGMSEIPEAQVLMKGVLSVRDGGTFTICDALLDRLSNRITSKNVEPVFENDDRTNSPPPLSPAVEIATEKVGDVEVRARSKALGTEHLITHGFQTASFDEIENLIPVGSWR